MRDEDAGRSYASNRESAEDLDWTPELWSMSDFGDDLDEQVRAFQATEGIEPTGIVDSVTHMRARMWLVGEFWEDPTPSELVAPPANDYILVGGERASIVGAPVVTPDEPVSLAIERYYEKGGRRRSRFGERKCGLGGVDRAGLHWTGTRSALQTWRKAWRCRRSVSTHFEIDWNGTIYQLVDVVFRAYHYGIGWFNDRSVGVDLTNPVALGRTAAANRHLAMELGQVMRPVLSGYRVGTWRPGLFLGPTAGQLSSLRALMAALHEHVGIPLIAPADDPDDPLTLHRIKGLAKASKARQMEKMPPGWYHHVQGKGNRWDHLGVCLTRELEAAREVAR